MSRVAGGAFFIPVLFFLSQDTIAKGFLLTKQIQVSIQRGRFDRVGSLFFFGEAVRRIHCFFGSWKWDLYFFLWILFYRYAWQRFSVGRSKQENSIESKWHAFAFANTCSSSPEHRTLSIGFFSANVLNFKSSCSVKYGCSRPAKQSFGRQGALYTVPSPNPILNENYGRVFLAKHLWPISVIALESARLSGQNILKESASR